MEPFNQLSMEHHNRGRRQGRLNRIMSSLVFGSLLAGCEAGAKDPRTETPQEPTKLTLEECAAIKVQVDMIECFEQLSVQNQAEIAALDAKEKELDSENANLGKDIALGNARIEVLSKEAKAAMQRLEDRILEPER